MTLREEGFIWTHKFEGLQSIMAVGGSTVAGMCSWDPRLRSWRDKKQSGRPSRTSFQWDPATLAPCSPSHCSSAQLLAQKPYQSTKHASTSLDTVLHFVPIFPVYTAHPVCGKERTPIRIQGTASKCCPPVSASCRALQSGKVTTVPFLVLELSTQAKQDSGSG